MKYGKSFCDAISIRIRSNAVRRHFVAIVFRVWSSYVRIQFVDVFKMVFE